MFTSIEFKNKFCDFSVYFLYYFSLFLVLCLFIKIQKIPRCLLYKTNTILIHIVTSVRFPLRPPGCHESCSECRGPSRQECAACSDPAALLKGGECVLDCGAAFYGRGGVCHGNVDLFPSCIVGKNIYSVSDVFKFMLYVFCCFSQNLPKTHP